MDSNTDPKKTNPQVFTASSVDTDTKRQIPLVASTGFIILSSVFAVFFSFMAVTTLTRNRIAGPGTKAFVFALGLFGAVHYGRFAIATPFKTILDGNTITTKGYIGTHSVSLDTIVSVKRFFLVSGQFSGASYGLRIRDKSGSKVIVPLGMIAGDQRHTFCQAMYPFLAVYIDKDKKLQREWQIWAS